MTLRSTTRRVLTASMLLGCSTPPAAEPDMLAGMVRIPEGAFWRGCEPVTVEAWGGGCEDDPDGDIALDVPMREIQLSEYWIDQYEATIGEYVACFDAGVCPGIGTVAPPNIADRDRLPINGVSWFDAQTYCEWRGKRLPTEAEWEKAARGTDQRQLPWGDDYSQCDIANLHLGEFDATCDEPKQVLPVDAYPSDRSPYGVIGMGGNVQEWVSDWKGKLYYADSPSVDPTGPAQAEPMFPLKILRGGYYDSISRSARVSRRRWLEPETRVLGRVGVRCASSVSPDQIEDPLAP